MNISIIRWFSILIILLSVFCGGSMGQTISSTDILDTTIRITLESSGDALWTVELKIPLNSDSDRVAFEQLSMDLKYNNDPPISITPFSNAAVISTTNTGRIMELTEISHRFSISDDFGSFTTSFVWTNFTHFQDSQMELGDVFYLSPDDTWLPVLLANQELIVEFPPNYIAQSSSHGVSNGTLHVMGPSILSPGEPSAVLIELPQVTPPTDNSFDLSDVLLPIIGSLLLISLIIVFISMKKFNWSPLNDLIMLSPYVSSHPLIHKYFFKLPVISNKTEKINLLPLISDEEVVLNIIKQRGGRIKQVEIVEKTDWSNAKVSQILSHLEQKGFVDKLRIGRENLISLRLPK
jgi:hypothetical protein